MEKEILEEIGGSHLSCPGDDSRGFLGRPLKPHSWRPAKRE